MKNNRLLPIGTVVYFNDLEKTYMIVARAMQVQQENEIKTYDYGACMYPEGFVDTKLIYFNDENIDEILFKGYEDETEEELSAFIIKRAGEYLSTDFMIESTEEEW